MSRKAEGAHSRDKNKGHVLNPGSAVGARVLLFPGVMPVSSQCKKTDARCQTDCTAPECYRHHRAGG